MIKRLLYTLLYFILLLLFSCIPKGQTTLDKNLVTAVKKQDYDAIIKNLKYGADPNTSIFGNETRVLHFAINNENLKIVKLLVEAGARLTTADADHNSPLTLASINGYYDIASYLIEQGADVNFVNPNKAGTTALMEAAGSNSIQIIELLLQNNADINAVDTNGFSALTYATKQNNMAATVFIVEAGADTTIAGKQAGTEVNCLDIAILQDCKDTADYLRSIGIKPLQQK